jgi:disulfide bond formation protein DsbB
MPSPDAGALAQQLRQHGEVPVALHRGKVAFAVALLICGPTAFLIGFGSEGIVQLVIAAVVSLAIWVGVGVSLSEWLLGAGPAFQIDRTGVTVRRWREPLRLEWSDMLAVTARPQP